MKYLDTLKNRVSPIDTLYFKCVSFKIGRAKGNLFNEIVLVML